MARPSPESSSEFALPAATALGPEHRRATRVPQDGLAVILPCRADGRTDEPRPVRLRDVSLRGISFVDDVPLARGEQFVYRLPTSRPDTPTPMLCTVAHCRPDADGGYRIGAEYTCVLHEETPRQFNPAAGEDVERIRRSILG